MSKNNDIKATIKSLIENVQLGNKSGSEVAQSVNIWLKEGGEAIKVKIEDEVERSVSKMGFVKRGEFEALKQEVAALKKVGLQKELPPLQLRSVQVQRVQLSQLRRRVL